MGDIGKLISVLIGKNEVRVYCWGTLRIVRDKGIGDKMLKNVLGNVLGSV